MESSAGPTLPSMMAGKWLVERSAAAGGAWGRIGGRPKAVRPKPLGKVAKTRWDAGDSADGAGNGGGPKPLGKVDASIIDCILD